MPHAEVPVNPVTLPILSFQKQASSIVGDNPTPFVPLGDCKGYKGLAHLNDFAFPTRTSVIFMKENW